MPNRKADTFNRYCVEVFKTFNNKSLKTLIVDRGKDFAEYIKLEDSLKVDVYFVGPYRSWQRGTNENTNRLILEFFLKKFDFSTINQYEVDTVENIINNRSLKCLGYKTPFEAFNEEQAKCYT